MMPEISYCRPLPVFLAVLLAAGLLPPQPAEARETTFSAGFSLREEYDSNLDLTAVDRRSAWLTTASPSFSLDSRGRNDLLTLLYSLGLTLNHSDSSENEVSHNLSLSASKQVARSIEVTFTDSLVRTADPFAVTVERLFVGQRQREEYWTNTADLELSYEYARESTVSLGYSHSILENRTSDREDHQRHNPRLSIDHRISEHWGLSASYGFIKGEFERTEDLQEHDAGLEIGFRPLLHHLFTLAYDFTVLDYRGGPDDHTTHAGLLGWAHELDARTRLEAGAGLALLERDRAGDVTAFQYGLDLARSFRRSTVSLTGLGGLAEEQFTLDRAGEGLGVVKFWTVEASFDHQWLENVSSHLSGAYRDDQFLERTPAARERTYSAGASLSYSLGTGYALSAGYDYRQLEADLEADEFTDHRFFVELSLDHELWSNARRR